MRREDLLRELLQLPKLHLRAQTLADGLLQGHHQSPFKGFNVEFAEHRAYLPGDELKFVDWKVLAKTDRLYVKHYEQETNLQLFTWVDPSPSMAFKSGDVSKWEMSILLASSFAYLALNRGDAVGAGLLTPGKSVVPPQSHLGHFRTLCEYFEASALEPSPSGLVAGLESQLASLRRRGIVMIFSDFYEEPESLEGVLRTLAARQMDVVLFQVLDPVELGMTLEGQWRLKDMETEEFLPMAPAQLRSAYLQELKDHQQALARLCLNRGTSFHVVNTGMHPMGVCLEVLERHGRAM